LSIPNGDQSEKMRKDSESDQTPAKKDRRVSRTRRALRHALFELIQEKGYDSVTVEDITDRANLGRATFYLHYRDKEDLLIEQFTEIAKDRVQVLSEIPLSAWEPQEGPPVIPLLNIFEHAAENVSLYQLVLLGESNSRIMERIRQIIATSIQALIEKKTENEKVRLSPQVPIELISAYFAGALVSSLVWWLAQEEHPSPEEMTIMFQQMFFPGMRNVFKQIKVE